MPEEENQPQSIESTYESSQAWEDEPVVTIPAEVPSEALVEKVKEEVVNEVEKTLEQSIEKTEVEKPSEVPSAEIPQPPAEKIVEKFIEKPIEFKDENSKALYEAFINGEEDKVFRYLSEKNKDYTTMSDQDVMREKIRKDHPNWNTDDVELELRDTFGDDLEKKDLADYDQELDKKEYDAVVAFNRQVDRNIDKMKRQARDARYELNDSKPKNLELPQIKPNVNVPQQPSAEEIAEQNSKWEQSVDSELPKFQSIINKIDGEEVVYKVTDDTRKQLGEFLKTATLPSIAKDLGWYNEDGTTNILKVVEDVQSLKDREKIAKAIFTQAKNSAKKEVIKDIKNIDSDKRPVQNVGAKTIEQGYEAVA